MRRGRAPITAVTRSADPPGTPVVADTHVLIWYLTAPGMLSTDAIVVLEAAVSAGQPIFVAAASLIELVYVAEKRSDSIDADTLSRLLTLIEEPGSPITIAAMTAAVALSMIAISRDHVRDPFDRAIVATAQASGLRLVTRDSRLTQHFPDICLW